MMKIVDFDLLVSNETYLNVTTSDKIIITFA